MIYFYLPSDQNLRYSKHYKSLLEANGSVFLFDCGGQQLFVWQNLICHYWNKIETVVRAQIFSQCFVSPRFQIMIIWAIHSSVFSHQNLSFFHCNFDKSDDLVSLPGHECLILETFIAQFNYEPIFFDRFVHPFDR